MLATDPETLAVQAAEDLHAAAVEFVAACEALTPLAETLDYCDRRHRAALSVAGLTTRRPVAREHAAEFALGSLVALAPYVRRVMSASRDYAREQLLDIPDPTEGP